GGIVAGITGGGGGAAAQRQRVAQHGEGLSAEADAPEGLGAGELALGGGEAGAAGGDDRVGWRCRRGAVEELGLGEGGGVAEGGEGVGGAGGEEERRDLDG